MRPRLDLGPLVAPALLLGGQQPTRTTGECTDLPVAQQLCEIGQGVGGFLGNPVGSVVGIAGDSAMRALTEFVINGAVYFLGQIASVITEQTSVEPTAAFFGRNYLTMAGLAAAVIVPLLLLSIGGAVLHGDTAALGRAVTMTFAAGLGTFAAVGITTALLAVTDAMCEAIAAGLGADLQAALDGVGTGLLAAGEVKEATAPGTGATVPLFAGFIAAIVVVIAAIGVWLELLIRQVAVYAALLFFPLALAGLVWPSTSRWARRLAELLVSLILAKFVIVALLALGASGLASGGEGFSGVLAGAALLLLALFAPYVVLRIVGVAQVALAGAGMDGMRSRTTGQVAHSTTRTVNSVRSMLSSGPGTGGGLTVAGASGGSAGASAASGAAGAVAVPLAAAQAAGQQVRAAGGRAVASADAATDPYAPSSGRGSPRRGGPGHPAVAQVEARLADEH